MVGNEGKPERIHIEKTQHGEKRCQEAKECRQERTRTIPK
jgi:hypothetical protein